MSRRVLSWRSVLSHLRNDRVTPSDVREERLQAFAEDLSAWRGRSGRRYVVRRHPLDLVSFKEAQEGICLAVARDEGGRATIVLIAGVLPIPSWFARAKIAGATELHVHSLFEGEEERRAILRDLRP